MRILPLIVAGIVLPMAVYAAAPLKPKNEWKPCQQDTDCVIIKGICRPAAVNAVFKADAEKYYAAEAKITKCPQEFWHPPTPVARCRLNSCETVQKDK